MSIVQEVYNSGESPIKINNFIKDINENFIYCTYTDSDGDSRSNIFIYVYNRQDFYNGSEINSHDSFNNDYVTVPTAEKHITGVKRWQFNTSTHTFSLATGLNCYVPFQLYFYKDIEYINFLNSLESKKINDIIIAINNCKASIDSVKDSVDDVSKNVKETNDFLKDTSDDDVDYSLPSSGSFDDSNINAGLDTIFSNVQNMFTKTSENIIIPVPFSNKTIVIPANYIQNQLEKFDKNDIIKTFVQAVYAYIISKYIYQDLQKRMEEIKEGSILRGKTDTNIKADMM